ncbi:MAG: 2-oxoacid:acceptor oxidoreductase subunit alpha [Myxococcota bacterium]|jgi:2-oxoglutarate ferredoxin oxidoreductase subunit alpha|nr:2-oxoacid:acceptor oxidoreductase subunit alpha [Myxococcota bacterium]
MSGRTLFLQGNEACVEAALYAGVRFFAGYPITPSTEIAEGMARQLPRVGGTFVQMEDELASICAILGASLAGVKAMTATSGPGFSLMQEAIGYGAMAEIPTVVVNVQRGGPATGLPTHVAQADVMQARWGTHGDHSMIALTASNLPDVFRMTVEAFNLSETFRTPVVLLLDEVVGHMREKLTIPEPGELPVVERLYTQIPPNQEYHPYLPREDGRLPMAAFGGKHRHNVTGLAHNIWGFPTEDPDTVNRLIHNLVEKVEHEQAGLTFSKEHFLDDAETLLISYGSSARSCLDLVRRQRQKGERIGLLELNTLWPFPSAMIREYCSRVRRVAVVEMNMGQVVREVQRVAPDKDRVFLINQVNGVFIDPETIFKALRMIRGRGL